MGRLMGYNVFKIPTVYHAIYHRESKFGTISLGELKVHSMKNRKLQVIGFNDLESLQFDLPRYWGHAHLVKNQ